MSREIQALSRVCDEKWFQQSLEEFFKKIESKLRYGHRDTIDPAMLSTIVCNLIRDDWEKRANEHVIEKFGKESANPIVVRTAEELVAMVLANSANSL